MNKKIESVYIHIPFCTTICTYCDFCKIYYNQKYIKNYLESLKTEIKTYYQNDIIKTIYIGGGTPSSLSIEELKELFSIIKVFKLSKNYEFTVELNIEHINKELLELLYQNSVNRLSIGIQTLNPLHLKMLNRNHTKDAVLKSIKMAQTVGFTNINVDLIYAIPNQTKEELIEDINGLLELNVNHISTYSLIIEPRTMLHINKINNIEENLDYDMYKIIKKMLTQAGYNNYEFSNYSKVGYESRHNLQYWNNLEYYGFGAGASGYINNIRYKNTSSVSKYINNNYRVEEEIITPSIKLENEFILGLRKIEGINKQDFFEKYGFDIYEVPNVKKLVKERKLIDNSKNIYISPQYIYLSNEILIDFMV